MSQFSSFHFYNALDRSLAKLEILAAIIGGAMVLAAMLLTSADVVMRYAFHQPLTFSYHLTEFYLMVGMMTMPLAWGFRTGGYIRVSAFCQVLPPKLRSALLRLGLLVSALYVGALAWLSAENTIEFYQRGDVQMGVIDWPLWLSWIWVPVGVGLLAARLLVISVGPYAAIDPGHDVSEETV